MCRACKTTEAIFTVIGYIPYEWETLLLRRLHALATGVGETKLCLDLRDPLPGSQLILWILWRVKPNTLLSCGSCMPQDGRVGKDTPPSGLNQNLLSEGTSGSVHRGQFTSLTGSSEKNL